ncbi:tripartite tricarboxylate transporter permease [Marinobacterium lutimaris]|uniref:tripartite tricarboxylate transporter permease n=1 Tax=Marinobacterium lutimaris TaxID=568106 RepID=UPI000CDF01AE|nr:tripartite tricarboxylate transporter permease [Marinobacterium lutimaris]
MILSESANNTVTDSAMIPTLALGIPGEVVTAILVGALVIQAMTPGVRLMTERVETVNAIFISLILINITMLFLALPNHPGLWLPRGHPVRRSFPAGTFGHRPGSRPAVPTEPAIRDADP